MISVNEVDRILKHARFILSTEIVSLEYSIGRTLASDMIADRDFPPYNRVAMDGICVRLSDLEAGIRQFTVSDVQGAGDPQKTLVEKTAMEIMTGASLPHNADVVIRYEDITIEDGIAQVHVDTFKHFQNVHHQGSDRKKGEIILQGNSVIRPAEIGVLATIGASHLEVLKPPRIVIISTGDELVEVDETPLPHQIRKSNVHTLRAALQTHHLQADLVHLTDNKLEIKKRLSTLIAEYDVLLMSGAVSKGKFDFLPDVLDELGVKKQFHRVAQRPGKPFWFGTTADCTVFAFPGNPVSTYACLLRYCIPWLNQNMGRPQELEYATLSEAFTFKPDLTFFLQVTVKNEDGRLVATPIPGNGSGDLANLSVANGFLELPSNQTSFESGAVFPVWRF